MSWMRMAYASLGVCCLLATAGQYWVRSVPEYELSRRPALRGAARTHRAVAQRSGDPTDAADAVAAERARLKNGDAGKDACCGTACGLDLCYEGDPWNCTPKGRRGLKIGGWFQAGYNNKTGRPVQPHPDRLHPHQGYFTLRRWPTANAVGTGGFRTDLVYGVVDAAMMQAFGNNPGEWGLSGTALTMRIYGWPLPQAYAELAYNDLSVKIGH